MLYCVLYLSIGTVQHNPHRLTHKYAYYFFIPPLEISFIFRERKETNSNFKSFLDFISASSVRVRARANVWSTQSTSAQPQIDMVLGDQDHSPARWWLLLLLLSSRWFFIILNNSFLLYMLFISIIIIILSLSHLSCALSLLCSAMLCAFHTILNTPYHTAYSQLHTYHTFDTYYIHSSQSRHHINDVQAGRQANSQSPLRGH